MAFTDENRITMDRLDAVLRQSDPFQNVPITLKGYKAWYSLLLGSLTVLIGDNDEVVLGHADYDEASDNARLVLFTSTLVVVADVVGASGENAEVFSRASSRRAIRSLDVQVSDRHDVDSWGRAARTWPGALMFTVEYSSLSEPLKFKALSYNPWRPELEADAMKLLVGLREDLADSSQQ
jgi:hypothetical protein